MWLIILSLISIVASGADTRPLVIYLGGAKASDAQMRCWEAGAKRDSRYGSKIDFKAYAFPACRDLNHGCYQEPVAKKYVDQIAESLANESRPLIIVGHSTGSDLANELAMKLKDKNIMRLIDIDGYGVPANWNPSFPVTCVSAIGVNSSGQEFRSPYYNSTHGLCPHRELRDMRISGCDTPMCLHFRMVNKSAPSNLNGSTYGDHGYAGCTTNLDWLGGEAGGAGGGTSGSSFR